MKTPIFFDRGTGDHRPTMRGDMRARKPAEDLAVIALDATHAKSGPLANISHEIRLPMNGPMGMTGLFTAALNRWLVCELPPRSVSASTYAAGFALPKDTLDKRIIQQWYALDEAGNLLGELFDTYTSEAEVRIRAIRAAIRSGDCAALEHAAHALKGTSVSVGAVRMAAVSQQLECLGRAAQSTDGFQLLPQLEEEFVRVRVAMATLPAGRLSC